jgi:hypothetical protein
MLQMPEVMEALIQRIPTHVHAVLQGYARYRLDDYVFPAIVADSSARVQGLLYTGLTVCEFSIIDAFEDSLYSRRLVWVDAAGHGLKTALSYAVEPNDAHLMKQHLPWSLDDFSRELGQRYVSICMVFRSSLTTKGNDLLNRPDVLT